jgi:hypothetical protein
MHYKRSSFCSITALALLVPVLSACGAAQAIGIEHQRADAPLIVDIRPSPVAAATENKVFVKITEVRDLRKFDAHPSDLSTPSLFDAEINNPRITSRAIARKRRASFSYAGGDIMLPEGSTVAALVRSTAQKALQDKGYAVVDETSPDYAAALPLALDIDQFWGWDTLIFADGDTIEFKSSVRMTGHELVGDNAPPAEGRTTLETSALSYGDSNWSSTFERTWTSVIEKGLADLAASMKAKIRPPHELQ